ncbi:unnamed protein product [Chrysodeixis includens]|uniref:Uncharacterized protein n=1 Tax=Chrysodeixis includens TaxID=689277 RepID=A0A9N8PYG2_CHRIL|nr:unnamed protein product [Chrysodeixis includens]
MLIRCLTVRSISLLSWMSEPRYEKSEQTGRRTPSSVMASGLERPPKSQNIYSIFVLLIFKPTLFSSCCQTSNLLWIPGPSSPTRTMSSACPKVSPPVCPPSKRP